MDTQQISVKSRRELSLRLRVNFCVTFAILASVLLGLLYMLSNYNGILSFSPTDLRSTCGITCNSVLLTSLAQGADHYIVSSARKLTSNGLPALQDISSYWVVTREAEQVLADLSAVTHIIQLRGLKDQHDSIRWATSQSFVLNRSVVIHADVGVVSEVQPLVANQTNTSALVGLQYLVVETVTPYTPELIGLDVLPLLKTGREVRFSNISSTRCGGSTYTTILPMFNASISTDHDMFEGSVNVTRTLTGAVAVVTCVQSVLSQASSELASAFPDGTLSDSATMTTWAMPVTDMTARVHNSPLASSRQTCSQTQSPGEMNDVRGFRICIDAVDDSTAWMTGNTIRISITVILLLLIAISIGVAAAAPFKMLNDQKEAASEDRAAQQKMLRYISHEVRNPAHVIKATAAILEENLRTMPTLHQDIALIVQSSEHLHKIVNDIIAMTKINSGGFSVQMEPVNVRELVEMLASTHKTFVRTPISWKVDQHVPRHVITDPTRLSQVLMNGLTNAGKFCTTGCIEIRVSKLERRADERPDCPDYLLFCIADTGPGFQGDAEDLFRSREGSEQVPSTPLASFLRRHVASHDPLHKRESGSSGKRYAVQPHPVTPVRRVSIISTNGRDVASAADAARSQGSGLGLHVARQLARKLGGELTLTRPENQTLFQLKIPIVPQPESARQAAEPVMLHTKRTSWDVTAPNVPQQTDKLKGLSFLSGSRDVGGTFEPVVSVNESQAESFRRGPASVVVSVTSASGRIVAKPATPLFTSPGFGYNTAPLSASPRAAEAPLVPTLATNIAPINIIHYANAANGTALDVTDDVSISLGGRTTRTDEGLTDRGSSNRIRGLHVLIADDDLMNRKVLSRMMDTLGCTFVVVANGTEAQAAINLTETGAPATQDNTDTTDIPGVPSAASPRPRKFDAFVFDLNMPDVTGFQLAEGLRTLGVDRPIIAATGEDSSVDAACSASGFTATLHKPYSLQDLKRVLSALNDSLSLRVAPEVERLAPETERAFPRR